MPASKAELVVECRQIMLGTPYKMPLSGMKLHELHAAKETLLKMKADHTKALSDIPVVGPGRPKPRPVEFVEQEGEDGVTDFHPALLTAHARQASFPPPNRHANSPPAPFS